VDFCNYSSGPASKIFVVIISAVSAFISRSAVCITLAAVGLARASQVEPLVAGKLEAPPKNEASGLAASSRGDLLWTHDDSGGAAILYAVSLAGERRGQLRLENLRNTDWEDLAAVELDGQAWLVVGDIGDNDAKRPSIQVHFAAEPDPALVRDGAVRTMKASATLQITFEDGPRDSESLAVDPVERALYLLSKRDAVPRLYRVEIPAAPLRDATLRARFVGLVPHVTPGGKVSGGIKGKIESLRARPCAMDFARDGSAAVVLTYGEVLFFPRRSGEAWAVALARAPVRLGAHGLPQAEAICFTRDGEAIYVASESSRKLLRYARPR
jgi:hypothetical protein